MLDFTNIHILGVTVALAWPLPHKTVFENEHDHMATEKTPEHNTKISVSDVNKTASDRILDHYNTYYDRHNYHSHRISNAFYDYLQRKTKIDASATRINPNRYYLNSNNQRVYEQPNQRWDYPHRVYPALRMRRHIEMNSGVEQENTVHPEVRQFLKHHRDTRFDLYNRIEKYLNAYVAD